MQTARISTLGKFHLEEKIGEGGMGIVYRAYDPDLHRSVAIKKIHPRFAGDEEYAHRFLTEARSVAATIHPNIAQIFSIHADDKEAPPYFVMEYVNGESLDKRVTRDGPLPVELLLQIAIQSARGLAAAHTKGIVHRDVKPSNILITQKSVVKLVDFGLARRTEDISSLTQVGVILGTPHYVSPEQGRGRSVDHRSDIYSLGCTLFYLATGREPFQRDNKVEIIVAHANEPAPLARSLRADLPIPLDEIFQRMLRKDPSDRYQSYEQLIEDIDRVLRKIGGGKSSRVTRSRWAAITLGGILLAGGVALLANQITPRTDHRAAVQNYFGSVYVDRDSEEMLDFKFANSDLQQFFLVPPSSDEQPETRHPRVERGQLSWQNYSGEVPFKAYFDQFEELFLRSVRFRGNPDFEIVIGHDPTLPHQRLRIAFAVGPKNDSSIVECYAHGERIDIQLEAPIIDFTLDSDVEYNFKLRRRAPKDGRVPFEFIVEQVKERGSAPQVRTKAIFSIPEESLPRGEVTLRGAGIRQPIWSVSMEEVMILGQLDHDRIGRELDGGAI